MGEIDKLYRAERDRAQMYRGEAERLRASNEGWAREVERLEGELRHCRAEIEGGLTTAEWINSSLQAERRLADVLAAPLIRALDTGDFWSHESEFQAAVAHWREARPQ